MRKRTVRFSDHCSLCVFPKNRGQLSQAIAELGLAGGHPVLVLVGGYIQEKHAEVTQRAIETIAAFADKNNALVICGGSDLGIMASIGHTRQSRGYGFPLLGINLENKVTWPNMPWYARFFGWGRERWPLSTGYSHFILVPGFHYGEDSPWIADAAAYLSKGSRAVTLLANGGSVTKMDIALSLENRRPVIVLAGTGRLADDMANQPGRSAMITVVQAGDRGDLLKVLDRILQVDCPCEQLQR